MSWPVSEAMDKNLIFSALGTESFEYDDFN